MADTEEKIQGKAGDKETKTPKKSGNEKQEGKLALFFKGVKGEFRKIIWPDRMTLTKQSVAVVVVSVITGALIAVIDRVLQYGINFIIK